MDPWVRKIPWRRKWQPTPRFLPGKFDGQRSLEGYSSWVSESDTTEHGHTKEQSPNLNPGSLPPNYSTSLGDETREPF